MPTNEAKLKFGVIAQGICLMVSIFLCVHIIMGEAEESQPFEANLEAGDADTAVVSPLAAILVVMVFITGVYFYNSVKIYRKFMMLKQK